MYILLEFTLERIAVENQYKNKDRIERIEYIKESNEERNRLETKVSPMHTIPVLTQLLSALAKSYRDKVCAYSLSPRCVQTAKHLRFPESTAKLRDSRCNITAKQFKPRSVQTLVLGTALEIKTRWR